MNMFTAVLLLTVYQLTQLVSARTYYVMPSSSTLCPESEQTVACLTLSQYASNSSSFIASSNITLVLLPGNHSLDSELLIKGITGLSVTLNGASTASVSCSCSGRFRFENISEVRMSHVTFIGCVNNDVMSVDHFNLDNCIFDGQSCNGTGLDLHDVASASITYTNFTLNTGRYVLHPIRSQIVVKGGGALVINSSKVSVSYSYFNRNEADTGGAIFCLESSIEVDNSKFESNTGIRDGGAVAAAYSVIMINNSVFFNNSLSHRVSFGGAVEVFSGNSTIANCVFSSNSARRAGGALDLFVTVDTNFVINSTFANNSASDGSAIIVDDAILEVSGFANFFGNQQRTIYTFGSKLLFSGSTTITNNSFTNSSELEDDGGTITCFRSELTFSDFTNLSYNKAKRGGAISATESKIDFHGNVLILYNEAHTTGGGIYAYLSDLNFWGSTVLTGNVAVVSGGGIHSVATTSSIFMRSSLSFIANSAASGGGMCLELNARIYLSKDETECLIGSDCSIRNPDEWIRVEFNSNTANYGGALYIFDNTTAGTCNSIPFQAQETPSECFFQGIALHPRFWDHLNILNIYFNNNSAHMTGKTLYGGLLDRCTVSSFAEMFRVTKYRKLNPKTVDAVSYFLNVSNMKQSDLKSEVSSDPVRVCFCKNNQPDCGYKPPTLVVRRGMTVNVSLVAVDQVNNTIPNTIIHSSLISQDEKDDDFTNDGCTVVPHTIYSTSSTNKLYLHADGPCKDSEASKTSIDIVIMPCLTGFIDSGTACVCDPILHPTYVVNCSIDNESVLRKESVWISAFNSTELDQESIGYLTCLNCPFDYCISDEVAVNLNIPNGSDMQCAFNRSGRLCGSCKEGLSLTLGSSRCLSCSNNFLALLILFAAAGVALLVFLLACNLTVAVGTINGALFYANVIAINSAIFLPFDKPNILTIFIAWLNLDFGFESCFYDGMDGYAKIWLQFLFPVYTLFLVLVVIIASQYFQFFANLLANRNPVATLATLILLSYTKLLRTLIAAFSFVRLKRYLNISDLLYDSHSVVAWRIDANLNYFEVKRIPMFIAALLLFIAVLAYTFLLFSWQWLQLLPNRRCLRWIRNTKLNSFMDAYLAPYSRKYRFWTGLLLLARGVLFLVAAISNPGDTLLAVVCVTAGLSLLRELLKNRVYKKWLLTSLENLFIFNLAIFATACLYIREAGGNQAALAYTSTSIAFFTFLAILVYHTFTSFKRLQIFADNFKDRIKQIAIKKKNIPQNTVQRQDTDLDSRLREPMLETEYSLIVINSHSLTDHSDSLPNPVSLRGVTHTEIDGIPDKDCNESVVQ